MTISDPRPTARDVVREDAIKYDWTWVYNPSPQSDYFARGDEELEVVWSLAHPYEIAMRVNHFDGQVWRKSDTSPLVIVNARRILGAAI